MAYNAIYCQPKPYPELDPELNQRVSDQLRIRYSLLPEEAANGVPAMLQSDGSLVIPKDQKAWLAVVHKTCNVRKDWVLRVSGYSQAHLGLRKPGGYSARWLNSCAALFQISLEEPVDGIRATIAHDAFADGMPVWTLDGVNVISHAEGIEESMSALGWNQVRTAQEMGVTDRTVRRILSGDTDPPVELVNALGRRLTLLALERDGKHAIRWPIVAPLKFDRWMAAQKRFNLHVHRNV